MYLGLAFASLSINQSIRIVTGSHCVVQAGLDDMGTIGAQLGVLLGSHPYGLQGRVSTSDPVSPDLAHCLSPGQQTHS